MVPLIFFASVFLGMPSAYPVSPGSEIPSAHNIHLSYGRMAVEGSVAVCQLKFFRHDLEQALQKHHEDPSITLAATPAVEALFIEYLAQAFAFEADHVTLAGTVIASGEEADMWWYTLQYDAERPIRHYRVRNSLLFEAFPDQKNIFKVKHFPSEQTHAFYFVRGADDYEADFETD